jgi:hypothetical protein
MFIAKKLRQENVCEYLLYMWQIEDLIRALGLDMDRINDQIIKTYPVSDAEKKELYGWYESLADMMRMENVQEKGHLQLNKNLIIQLNDFHHLLLKSGVDAGYAAKFYHILPALSTLRTGLNDSEITDIELCFNFMYGIMVLRMKKAEISAQTLQTQAEITKFLVLLNKNYLLYSSGQLKLEADEV